MARWDLSLPSYQGWKGEVFPHTSWDYIAYWSCRWGWAQASFLKFCTPVLTCPCKALLASYRDAHTCKGSSELLVSPLLNRSRVGSTKCFNFMQWKHLKTYRHFDPDGDEALQAVVRMRSFYWTLNWYCHPQPFDQTDLPPGRVLK